MKKKKRKRTIYDRADFQQVIHNVLWGDVHLSLSNGYLEELDAQTPYSITREGSKTIHSIREFRPHPKRDYQIYSRKKEQTCRVEPLATDLSTARDTSKAEQTRTAAGSPHRYPQLSMPNA